MRQYPADLHIHSVLSPCADRRMTPRQIVERVREQGTEIIALTDHNASANVGAMLGAAPEYGVTVIPGMEVQSREDAHLICLFPDLDTLAEWQAMVDERLPRLRNRPEYFGEQWQMDAADQRLGVEERLLLTGVGLTVTEIFTRVRALGGICFPAHLDRPANSLLSILGFLPPELGIGTAEISYRVTPAEFCEKFRELDGVTMISASDAHRPEELTPAKVSLLMEAPTWAELVQALAGRNGRGVVRVND
ncbi:MAG: PHP domain-containing protein [Bacillota bacterium]